jgi:hypothetical protein
MADILIRRLQAEIEREKECQLLAISVLLIALLDGNE